MRSFTDQTGRTISVANSLQRIVSVVPSQTELLADLGLDKEVAGITKFCVHPADWFRSKTRIGGTKKLDLPLIKSLHPDLIIANKEENDQSQIETLATDFPVWVSDIRTLSDAKRMILEIGEITLRYFEAVKLLYKIDSAFDGMINSTKDKRSRHAAYLIWNHPMMAAGNDTFISAMMKMAGFHNVFENLTRYPEISDEQLKAANPELIILSSEPYHFNEEHVADFRKRFPGIRVVRGDGEFFSWYGSRLQHAPAYFLSLFEQIETVD